MRRTIATSCGMLAFAAAAQAQPCVPEVRLVSPSADISTDANTQRMAPAATYNSVDDEFMVVWFDTRNPGNNDIFGQRVDADGQPTGGNFAIMERADAQINPAIAHSATDNRYLVVWRTQESGFFNKSRGRILAADGSHFGSDFFVGEGFEQSVVYNSTDGEFFQSGRRFPGSGIFGQRIAGDGTLLSGLLIDGDGAPAPNGGVAYDSVNNRFLATYRNQNARDLRGRIINGDGTGFSPPFVISSIFPSSGRAAAVAFDPGNERYLVVFGDFNGSILRGQFVTADGQLDGPEFEIFDTGVAQTHAVVGFDPGTDSFVLAWWDSAAGSVVTMALAADGAGSGQTVPFAIGTAQGTPTLAYNSGNGEFLLAWPDNRVDGDGEPDIYARLIALACGCAADIDGDGDADVNDFFGYLDLFASGDPGADITGDGDVDVNDFFAYLDLFAQGC